MNNRYALDMTSGPFLKKILIFSLPLILTGMLQMLYNMADIVVVGRFAGGTSLAAVGATGPLVNLVLNIFFGLAMGSGVTAARFIGAKDDEAVSRCTHTAMTLSVAGGIAVAIFGYYMSESLLIMMDSPSDVLPLSTEYLKIYFLGAPGSLIFNFGASIVRATGDTKKPLIILTLSGLVNVILNLILVIVFSLGVAGVAIATIISQYISAVLIVIRLTKMDNACRFSIKKMRLHSKELIKIITIGIPAGVQNSLFSISNVIIQTAVNSFGSVAMAGIAAGSNFDSLIYTCTNAVSQTTMTFSSQNMGARRYENLGIVYKRCILLTLLIGVSLGSFGYVFRQQVVGIFSTDPAVIKIGAQRLALIMPFYFFCSLMDVGGGQLRGMGKSVEPMLISLVGGCGLRILWIYTVFKTHHTLNCLYWAYPISWSITFFVHFTFYFIEKKRITHQNEVREA